MKAEATRGARRRNRVRACTIAAGLAIVALCSACLPAPPLGTVQAQTAEAPQWPVLADPAILADGGHYYLFGTAVSRWRMPVHILDSLDEGSGSVNEWMDSTIEGMPQKPPWATNNHFFFWAPTVAKASNGTYVAFFASQRLNPPVREFDMCVGRATSTRPEGPYVAEATPFTCGIDGVYGAIDPSLFRGPDGAWYLYTAFTGTPGSLYPMALDANLDQLRNGAGMGCCRTDFPVYQSAFSWEGGWIENPSMTYDAATNTYLLAYSSGGDWSSSAYGTGIARCSTPIGLCMPHEPGPWLSANNGRSGTGGLSFFTDLDGSTKAVYASFTRGHEGASPRAATAAGVQYGSWNPTLYSLYPFRATGSGNTYEGTGNPCINGRDATACLPPRFR